MGAETDSRKGGLLCALRPLSYLLVNYRLRAKASWIISSEVVMIRELA